MLKSLLSLFLITFSCAQILGNLKSYKIYAFDIDDRICSQTIKRKVELSHGNHSAIFIHQARLNDHARIVNIDCKFQIDATPLDVVSSVTQYFKGRKQDRNLGLYAVIQKIDFRIDFETGECIDFIRFRRKSGSWSPKICGEENIAQVMILEGETDLESRLAYISNDGVIEVNIFVSKEPLRIREKMELILIFTPYKKCSIYTDFCGSSNLGKCISNEYFGDGLINCPFSKCTDETDCNSVYRNLMNIDPLAPCLEGDLSDCHIAPHGTNSNAKVTAGAVASLLLSFVVFVLCVWMCKKYGKLCFSADCANPPERNNQASRTIELQNRTEPPVPAITGPTAPPIDENKDLPPSYDSLFPQ